MWRRRFDEGDQLNMEKMLVWDCWVWAPARVAKLVVVSYRATSDMIGNRLIF